MTNTNDEIMTPVRENLTVLFRRRSLIALCFGILSLSLAFYGIIAGVNRTVELLHENGFTSFVYYTMISNALAALSVAFVFPFTVEGVRKKRFTAPKWAALMHYVATSSIAITMVVVLAFMSWASPADAFGEVNLVTHVFCPLFILISFFQMESGHIFTWKDRLLGVVPFGIYSAVYLIEVELIGEERGGWPDIYHVKEYLPSYLAIPLLLLIAFGVSVAVALVSNGLTRKRNKKMYMLWSDDMDPIEVRIEAFGLGRAAARSGDANSVQIPYDILAFLSKKYGLKTEDLMKPFVKGILMELKDREKR